MLIRVHLASPRLDGGDGLARALAETGASVAVLPRGAEPFDWLEKSEADVLAIDRELLGDDPRAGLARIYRQHGAPEVVVLHGPEPDLTELADLVSDGATTIPREMGVEPLAAVLARTADGRRLAERHAQIVDSGQAGRLDDFASDSPKMRRLLALARRVADTDTTLLVAGETGVGKEYLVRAIHEEGPRAKGPFVAVNCAALSESLLESELFGHAKGAFTGADRKHRGHFELAHGGTIFLDEIGEMPLHLQAKLLRVLQEREVHPVGAEGSVPIDVRVVAATLRDLPADIEAKRFRADLFYRLSVVTLEVPPLRERREDLARLVESHIEHFRAVMGRKVRGIQEDAFGALAAYPWPGNVRELMNVIERAVLLADGDTITRQDLPESITRWAPTPGLVAPSVGASSASAPGIDLDVPWRAAREALLESFDRAYFTALLEATHGRVGPAAERAHLSQRTLFDQLKRLGLRKRDFRDETH